MSIQEARRPTFQAWFAKNHPNGNLERNTEEVLRKMIAEQAWNAALDSVCVVLPEPHMSETYVSAQVLYDDEVKQAITAAGIRCEVSK